MWNVGPKPTIRMGFSSSKRMFWKHLANVRHPEGSPFPTPWGYHRFPTQDVVALAGRRSCIQACTLTPKVKISWGVQQVVAISPIQIWWIGLIAVGGLDRLASAGSISPSGLSSACLQFWDPFHLVHSVAVFACFPSLLEAHLQDCAYVPPIFRGRICLFWQADFSAFVCPSNRTHSSLAFLQPFCQWRDCSFFLEALKDPP